MKTGFGVCLTLTRMLLTLSGVLVIVSSGYLHPCKSKAYALIIFWYALVWLNFLKIAWLALISRQLITIIHILFAGSVPFLVSLTDTSLTLNSRCRSLSFVVRWMRFDGPGRWCVSDADRVWLHGLALHTVVQKKFPRSLEVEWRWRVYYRRMSYLLIYDWLTVVLVCEPSLLTRRLMTCRLVVSSSLVDCLGPHFEFADNF